MKTWTTHLHRDEPPVLIPESFALGALSLGPLWLALHQAWIPALLSAAAMILIVILVPLPFMLVLEYACVILIGLFGHDLRRWSIERRVYFLAHVLIARTEAEALGRLLAQRPHLAEHFAPDLARAGAQTGGRS